MANSKIIKTSTVLLLSILISCQHIKEPRETQEECLSDYFFLKMDEYGKPNSDDKVLLHLSGTDSMFVNPERVCSLYLIPNEERKEFPLEILNFPNLEYLWVGMRDFKALPNEIINLHQLKKLDLQHTGLTKLPDNIGDLKQLEELILLFSDIETLPNSICQLSNLKKLHLGGTKIKELPPCLNQLKSLKTFILFYQDKTEYPKELKASLEGLKKELDQCFFSLD